MARVLVFGAWDDGPGYPRARSLLRALGDSGHDLMLWRLPSALAGRRKVDLVRGPWRWPGTALRLLASRGRARAALAAARAVFTPDVVVVPYPGHFLAPLVRSVFPGPIVLDLFLSAHDAAVEDRGFFRPGSTFARALARLDRRACEAADLVLLDTPAHAERIASSCGLPPARVGWLPVGDPDAPAVASPLPPFLGPLRLLFFGTGVPLHGLPILVEAVRRCGGAVQLEVIGGDRRERAALAAEPAPGVRLGPAFLPRDRLQAALASAHLVGGVFGTSGKAERVVPFKVVHGLAAGRPVLTGDTVAVRAWLRPDEEVLLAPRGDAAALASRLRAIAAAPQSLVPVAAAARSAYERVFSPPVLARHVQALLARFQAAGARPAVEAAHV